VAKRKNHGAKMRGSPSSVPIEIPKGIEGNILEKSSAEGGITVQELVKQLRADFQDSDRIVARLIELEEKGKVSVVEPAPYRTFLSFLVSPLSLWFWGALTSAIASLALIYISSGVVLYLRYVFGGLLVLFLPGYSLVEALYAKKQELEGLTRIALSIGLSLALVPLTGLVLNYTPFGIRLLPVTVSLVMLTVVFLLLAVQRKHAYYKVAKRIP
jgi:Protein of unknown function (DUF1616)